MNLKHVKIKIQSLIILFISSILLIFFQNCKFEAKDFSQLNLSSYESGNGGGYAGKLSANYYYFIPNYLCQNNPSPVEKAILHEGKLQLQSFDNNNCSQTPLYIDLSLLEFSPFQDEFVAIDRKLYRKYPGNIDKIPDNIAEVICRDDFKNPKLEIVAEFNYVSKVSQSIIYSKNSNNEIIISNSRILSMNKVLYQSNEFNLNLDFSTMGKDKLFHTSMELKENSNLKLYSTVINEQKKSINVECIIGGALDTSLWKTKKISDLKTQTMFVDNYSRLYFTSNSNEKTYATTQLNKMHYYTLNDNNEVEDFTLNMFGDNFTSYERISTQENIFIFAAAKIGDLFLSWYTYNYITNKLIKLTQINKDPKSVYLSFSTFLSPTLTHDGFLSFFVQDNFTNYSILRLVNLSTGQIYDNELTSSNLNNNFTIHKESNQVIYLEKNIQYQSYQIKIFNPIDGNYRYIMTEIPNDFTVQLLMKSASYQSHSKISIIIKTPSSSIGDFFTLNIENGSIHKIASAMYLSWVSQDNNWLAFNSIDGKIKNYIYSVEHDKFLTNRPFEAMSNLGNEFYTNEGYFNYVYTQNKIYSFDPKQSNPKLILHDLEADSVSELCNSKKGKIKFLGSLPGEKKFIFSFDSVELVYYFYEIEDNQKCTLINNFPANFKYISSLKMTSIGFLVTFNNDNLTNPIANIFVPIDGRPPLKIDPVGISGSWQTEVDFQHRRIFLLGPIGGDQRVYQMNLF